MTYRCLRCQLSSICQASVSRVSALHCHRPSHRPAEGNPMNDLRSATERRQRRGRHTFACLAMAMVCALGAGCASGPPPRDLDLRGARVVPMATVPALDVNGLPGGKPVGMAVGAGTGSGAGVVVGAVACLSTGPFFPLCVAAIVPTAAGI